MKPLFACTVSLLIACTSASSAYAKHLYAIGGDFACLPQDPCPGKGFYDGKIKYCYKKSECCTHDENGNYNGCASQDDTGPCE